eukprot:Sro60_g034690.2  (676) ;mRNA; r:71874-74666
MTVAQYGHTAGSTAMPAPKKAVHRDYARRPGRLKWDDQGGGESQSLYPQLLKSPPGGPGSVDEELPLTSLMKDRSDVTAMTCNESKSWADSATSFGVTMLVDGPNFESGGSSRSTFSNSASDSRFATDMSVASMNSSGNCSRSRDRPLQPPKRTYYRNNGSPVRSGADLGRVPQDDDSAQKTVRRGSAGHHGGGGRGRQQDYQDQRMRRQEVDRSDFGYEEPNRLQQPVRQYERTRYPEEDWDYYQDRSSAGGYHHQRRHHHQPPPMRPFEEEPRQYYEREQEPPRRYYEEEEQDPRRGYSYNNEEPPRSRDAHRHYRDEQAPPTRGYHHHHYDEYQHQGRGYNRHDHGPPPQRGYDAYDERYHGYYERPRYDLRYEPDLHYHHHHQREEHHHGRRYEEDHDYRWDPRDPRYEQPLRRRDDGDRYYERGPREDRYYEQGPREDPYYHDRLEGEYEHHQPREHELYDQPSQVHHERAYDEPSVPRRAANSGDDLPQPTERDHHDSRGVKDQEDPIAQPGAYQQQGGSRRGKLKDDALYSSTRRLPGAFHEQSPPLSKQTKDGKNDPPRKPERGPEDPAKPHDTILIEVFPGVSEKLRRAKETEEAVAADFYTPATCFSCNLDLFCISDVKYFICPECRCVSPLDETSNGIRDRQGVGIAFGYKTLSRMQELSRRSN